MGSLINRNTAVENDRVLVAHPLSLISQFDST